jgi:hypothetical protein
MALNQATKFCWPKHLRDAMRVCCRVTYLAVDQRLSPGRMVATGFVPGNSVYGDVIAGSTRSLRNNHRSPNQNVVTWRLGQSHLRGIRTPTGPHSIASRSHKAQKLEARARDQAARYGSNRGAPQTPRIFSLSRLETVCEPSDARCGFARSLVWIGAYHFSCMGFELYSVKLLHLARALRAKLYFAASSICCRAFSRASFSFSSRSRASSCFSFCFSRVS